MEPLTDNGPKFVSEFFVDVSNTLEVKNVFIIEYYPQINCQADQSNSKIVSRLRHYVSEHETAFDTYQLPLTYAYSV